MSRTHTHKYINTRARRQIDNDERDHERKRLRVEEEHFSNVHKKDNKRKIRKIEQAKWMGAENVCENE